MMIEPLADIRARISSIESLVRRFESSRQQGAPAAARTAIGTTPSSSSSSSGPTFRATLEQATRPTTQATHPTTRTGPTTHTGHAHAAEGAKRTTVAPARHAVASRHAVPPSGQSSVRSLSRTVGGSAAPINLATTDPTTAPVTPIPDPRWTDILARDAAYLAAGAHGPTSATDPNPLYAGSYGPDVEARRRADGSLNPNDLPSSEGLTADQLLQARLAESVPNAVLATGQNEGVARPGQVQNLNDSYDLLAWIGQLRSMKAGTIPPFVQANGYTWTPDDIQRNLDIALGQARQNKETYNQRWQTRWALLRANGLGDIADREQASVQLADLNAPI